MYDELIKRLREDKSWVEQGSTETEHEISEHIQQAADAIEELSAYVALYKDGGETAMKVAQEYKEAYIAEHDARITEAKRLYDAFYESIKKVVELMPLKIVLPQPPKEE